MLLPVLTKKISNSMFTAECTCIMNTMIIIHRVDSYAEINDDVLLKQNKTNYYYTQVQILNECDYASCNENKQQLQ